MRVACPSCEARYRLDPAAISLPGRNVRCMKCGTEWFVAAPGPEFDPAALRALARETPPGDDDAAPRPPRRRAGDAEAPEAASDASGETAPRAADAPSVSPPDEGDVRSRGARNPGAKDEDGDADAARDEPPFAPADGRAEPAGSAGEAPAHAAAPRAVPAEPAAPGPAPRAKPRRTGGRWGALRRRDRRQVSRFGVRARAAAGRVAPPLAILGAIAALVLFREPVVAAVPRTASLYKLAGLPVNLQGLDFAELRVRLVDDGTGRALVVEGVVSNPTRTNRTLPPLALALKDAAGHDLYAWTIRPPAPRLEPGAREAFRSRLAAPPAGGRELVVRFAGDRDNVSRVGASADGAGARRGDG